MDYTLSNDHLVVGIKRKGAELCSIKQTGFSDQSFEYIWQAEPAVWARHAPILFPIVGKLRKNAYTWKEKEYYLPQHGFARDMDFDLLNQTETTAAFRLVASPASHTNYPFDFELIISYTLDGNKVLTSWEVKNQGQGPMPFSIGAHPGFNINVHEGETIEDYSITFDKPERVPSYQLEAGLVAGVAERHFLNRDTTLALTPTMFDNDAIILPGLASDLVTLSNKKGDYRLSISIDGFEYLGLWSKPGQPFICIEPWLGIADSTVGVQDISKKLGIRMLEPAATFSKTYFIQIG